MTILGFDLGQNLAACEAEWDGNELTCMSLWFSQWKRVADEDWDSLAAQRHVSAFVRAVKKEVAPDLVLYEEAWFAKWCKADPNDCYQPAAQAGWISGWCEDLDVPVACVDPRDAQRLTGMDKAARPLYMTGCLRNLNDCYVQIVGSNKAKPKTYSETGKLMRGHIADSAFLVWYGATRLTKIGGQSCPTS